MILQKYIFVNDIEDGLVFYGEFMCATYLPAWI